MALADICHAIPYPSHSLQASPPNLIRSVPSVIQQPNDTWKKIQTLLAKQNFLQADVDQIKQAEETFVATQRHSELIICTLLQRAKSEQNPQFCNYALQIAGTMEMRPRKAWESKIKSSQITA